MRLDFGLPAIAKEVPRRKRRLVGRLVLVGKVAGVRLGHGPVDADVVRHAGAGVGDDGRLELAAGLSVALAGMAVLVVHLDGKYGQIALDAVLGIALALAAAIAVACVFEPAREVGLSWQVGFDVDDAVAGLLEAIDLAPTATVFEVGVALFPVHTYITCVTIDQCTMIVVRV